MSRQKLVAKLQKIYHYFDYKSPYAYLAQEDVFRLGCRKNVEVIWVPYGLQIGKYLGEAALDGDGEDIIKTRNDHQWRRVRYAYMDCRREANKRGLTLLGPEKIFDSTLSHIAFLFISRNTNPERFHRAVFKRFWNRTLDLENYESIVSLMRDLNYSVEGFGSFAESDGKEIYSKLQLEAEADGVFGVPSWRINGELFWGAEHLGTIIHLVEK